MGGMRLGAEDALGRRPVVRGLGQEDVLDEGLRIPVDEREPGALHLDHDLVALEKAVVGPVEVDREIRDPVGDERLGLFEARPEPAAKDLVGDHQLVSAHRRLGRVILGIDVDELDHPVAVRAAGRGEQAGGDPPGDRDVLGERLRLPAQDVRPQVGEALIADEPRPPARAPRVIGRLDRPRPVGHGPGRVGNVAVEGAGRLGRGRLEGQPPVLPEIQAAVLGEFPGRPFVVNLPGVGPGLEGDRLGDLPAALVLQKMGEERGLDPLPKILGGIGAELDRARGRSRRFASSRRDSTGRRRKSSPPGGRAARASRKSSAARRNPPGPTSRRHGAPGPSPGRGRAPSPAFARRRRSSGGRR